MEQLSKRSQSRNNQSSSSATPVANSTPGTILWLPSRDRINNNDIEDAKNLVVDDCYSKFVVLLGTDTAKTEATVLIVKTFGGLSLRAQHRRNPLARMKYLPISPGAPHPDNGLLLELEGDPLLYNSCVKISEALKFRIGVLQPTMTEHKMTSTSYNTLKRYTSDVPVHSFVPPAKLEPTVVHRAALELSSQEPDHQNNPIESSMSASKSSNPAYSNHNATPPQLPNRASQSSMSMSKSSNPVNSNHSPNPPQLQNRASGSSMSASKSSNSVHSNHNAIPTQPQNGAFKQAQQRSISEPKSLQSGTDSTCVHQNQDPVRPLTQRQKRDLLLLGALCIDAVFVLIVAIGVYLFC